jgi:hypothetical protein
MNWDTYSFLVPGILLEESLDPCSLLFSTVTFSAFGTVTISVMNNAQILNLEELMK